MSIAFGLSLSSANAANTTETAPKVEAVNGGTLVYTGTIGQYGVEFTYTNLHMSPDEPFFSYRYTTVNTKERSTSKGQQTASQEPSSTLKDKSSTSTLRK